MVSSLLNYASRYSSIMQYPQGVTPKPTRTVFRAKKTVDLGIGFATQTMKNKFLSVIWDFYADKDWICTRWFYFYAQCYSNPDFSASVFTFFFFFQLKFFLFSLILVVGPLIIVHLH